MPSSLLASARRFASVYGNLVRRVSLARRRWRLFGASTKRTDDCGFPFPTIPLMIEARLFLENRPRFFRTGGSRWVRSATVVRGARMAPNL